MLIKKVRDDLEFFGMRQIEPRLGECRLDFVSYAHFLLASFSLNGVESMFWTNSLYANENEITSSEYAF